jgi:DNA (cytosine-5)-methyltransferase 1
MKAIDLFAGAGGLSLGLRMAGIDVVGAVEYDEPACTTYRHNLGHHVVHADILLFGPAMLERHLKQTGAIQRRGDIGLVAGGPPCPGFSLIGRSKISNLIKTGAWEGTDHRHAFIDDPRNRLFLEFVAYVRHFKPTYFIMENVQGMTSYQNSSGASIIDVIRLEFETLGYTIHVNVLDAADYGVPQHRKRVIFLGTRRKKQNLAKLPLPQIANRISARDAICDLPPVDARTGRAMVGAKLRNVSHPYLEMMQAATTASERRRQALNLHATRAVNPRDVAMFPLLHSGEGGKPRVLYRDLIPERMDDIGAALPPGYSLVEENGKPFVVGPRWRGRVGRWGFYDPTKFGDKMRRIRGDRPAPTMVAHLAKDGYMFIHPSEHRTITVREAARFQSFPDHFDFSAGGKVAMSSQFRQVGNAVPPLLAKRLGIAITEAENSHASRNFSATRA